MNYFVDVMFPFCLLPPLGLESSKALSAHCSAKRAAEAMQARTIEAVDVDGPQSGGPSEMVNHVFNRIP